MPRYECRFLDHGGNARDIQHIDAADDQEAVGHAHALHLPGLGAGFEVWDGDRHVHSHSNRPRRP